MNAAAAIPETADIAEWKPVQIIAVGLCFLLNMLDGADLLVMSFVAPVLSDEWSIAPADMSASMAS